MSRAGHLAMAVRFLGAAALSGYSLYLVVSA